MRPSTEAQAPVAGSSTSRKRLAERAILVLLLGCFVFFLSRTVADADLWGHVRFGGDLFDTGDLRRADPYSYLSGERPWINHEWLAEAAFYAAWAAAAGTGLVLLKMVVGLATVGLLFTHLQRRGFSAIRAGILLLLAYPLISIGLRTVRPQMFTYLSFLLVLLALEAADRGHWRRLWMLPAVFLLWVNLHGGFLAGLGILVVWAAAVSISRWSGRGDPGWPPPGAVLLGAVSLCFLATLANPWGVGLWHLLLTTATIPRPEITEWVPTPLLTFEGGVYMILLGLSAGALMRSSPPGLPLAIVYAVTAVMPLLAVRHLPLFALAALVIGAAPLSRLFGRRAADEVRPARPTRPAPRWFSFAIAGGGVAMAALSIPYLRGPAIHGQLLPMPARAVGLLEASGARGNMAVHFDWGEYAIWHLAPEIMVSWDGRRETVFGEEAYATNLAFFFGVGEWDRLLTEHDTNLALVSRQTPVYNLLKRTDPWTVVYEDSLAAVFAQVGSREARRIRATEPPALPITGHDLVFP